MADVFTLTGTLVDHGEARPLEGVRVTATPSQHVTRASDGSRALTDEAVTTDETGAFTLTLVHAAGLRYHVTAAVPGGLSRPLTRLVCDNHPAGASVALDDIPDVPTPLPPTAAEQLQAWIQAKFDAYSVPEYVFTDNGNGTTTATINPGV